MADSKQQTASGGIGFFGLLGILFIGLKLAGCINWSWWYVLAPLWGPPAVVIAICLLILLFAGACMAMAGIVKYFEWE